MKPRALAAVALGAVVSFLLGLVAAGGQPIGSRRGVMAPAALQPHPLSISVASNPVRSAGAGVDFSEVAARLNGSVVNVDAVARDERGRPGPRRFQREMTDEQGAPREGSGSGFIIDPAGFILTNHHVVEGADRVTVTLSDGRALRATIVGIDPAIDVALLQVTAANLPVAALGDSSTIKVGEWVCAIGNPLGYVHSVTVGVVSFLGRKLFDQSLDAFIQTDAAISFGNSGGPLINAAGEVIGMTTAISSQASNIGFAIPINQVVAVLPQLRDRGRVARGYAGVALTAATPGLNAALGLGADRGALVQDVPPDTPAARAGLRAYDLITAIDSRRIADDQELIREISSRAPGSVAAFEVWRDGVSRTVSLKLTERPLPPTTRPTTVTGGVRPVLSQEQGPLGITVRDLDEATMRRFALPDTLRGVQIIDVDTAGPARLARLRRGHIVLEINRQKVTSVTDFQRLVSTLTPGRVVAVYVFDPLTDERALHAVVLDPA